MQATKFRGRSLLVAAVLCSLCGCLRFGYGGRADAGSAGREGAMHDDAGRTPAAGSGGTGGSAGSAGKYSEGGVEDAAAGGDAEADDDDSGVHDSPDAGTDAGEDRTDGGPVEVSPKCPERPGALFCDGFEDPEFMRWAYTVSHNGSVVLSSERAYSGTTSLLATTGPPMPGTEARWATDTFAMQKSGHAWMRFYNWLPASVMVMKHFSVGVMSESVEPYDGFELRILPTGIDINSSDGVFAAPAMFPREQWVCVELHVFIDPNEGVYEAYLDGELAIRSPAVNTVPADGFSVAEVGIHYADPMQGRVRVFVDDVVVGRERIRCD